MSTILEAVGTYLQTNNKGTLGTNIFLGVLPELKLIDHQFNCYLEPQETIIQQPEMQQILLVFFFQQLLIKHFQVFVF